MNKFTRMGIRATLADTENSEWYREAERSREGLYKALINLGKETRFSEIYIDGKPLGKKSIQKIHDAMPKQYSDHPLWISAWSSVRDALGMGLEKSRPQVCPNCNSAMVETLTTNTEAWNYLKNFVKLDWLAKKLGMGRVSGWKEVPLKRVDEVSEALFISKKFLRPEDDR